MDNRSQMNDDVLAEDAQESGESNTGDEITASSSCEADAATTVPSDEKDLPPYEKTPEPQSGDTQPEGDDTRPEDDDSEPESDDPPEKASEPERKPAPTAVQEDTKAEKKDSQKKTSACKWMVLFAIVAAVIAIDVFFICHHAVLGNVFGKHEIYYSDTVEINLSGSDYKDYSQLSKISALKVIDLTHSSFSDLSDLHGCKNLQKVILKDKEIDAQDCIALFQNAPEARIVCKIKIDGQAYDSGITQLKADSADEKTQRLFAALVDLETLDLTACEVNDDTYRYLAGTLKKCAVIIRTEICGMEYKTDADSVVLNGKVSDIDARRVCYFRNLRMIDIKTCANPEKIDDYLSSHPDVIVNRPVAFLDKIVGTEDETADLRGSKYTLKQFKEALDEKLPELKKLKKIDMCGCGLSNQEMEQLCREYPDIKFVWMVHFKRWSVRTDAVVFSTLNGDGYEFYDQNDYAPVFKYCTDLIALDLGHSLIYDISPIASMKKLRAVILTDNKIHNISGFSKLKDLEFIEINVNRVESAEPLRNLKKLKYIDFWSSMAMTNLEPLYHHDELKIAIFHRTVSQAERRRFMKSNPNCDTYFRVDTVKTTTNRTWRQNPYRKKVKKAFKNWKYVVGFDEKTGNYIFDYDTDQYSIM